MLTQLTVKQVAAIRLLYLNEKHGLWEVDELAELFGVRRQVVDRIIRGQTRVEVTGGVSVSRRTTDTRYRVIYLETQLRNGRTNQNAFARELGITRQSVGALIRRYGLKNNTLEGGNTCSEE